MLGQTVEAAPWSATDGEFISKSKAKDRVESPNPEQSTLEAGLSKLPQNSSLAKLRVICG